MNDNKTESREITGNEMEGAIADMVDELLEGLNVHVIGVGGCGCNTVEYITKQKMSNVKTVGINTDKTVVNGLDVNRQMLIGSELTQGNGAQGDPILGKRSAELYEEQILNSFEEADIVVIAAGLGGGTGSGASKVVADLAKRNGKLVVSYAVMPFSVEGDRYHLATKSLKELSKISNATTVFENDKIVEMYADKTPKEAMQLSGRMLHQVVKRLQLGCLVEFFTQCGVSTEAQNEIYSKVEPDLAEVNSTAETTMMTAQEEDVSKEYSIPRLDSFLETYAQ